MSQNRADHLQALIDVTKRKKSIDALTKVKKVRNIRPIRTTKTRRNTKIDEKKGMRAKNTSAGILEMKKRLKG